MASKCLFINLTMLLVCWIWAFVSSNIFSDGFESREIRGQSTAPIASLDKTLPKHSDLIKSVIVWYSKSLYPFSQLF